MSEKPNSSTTEESEVVVSEVDTGEQTNPPVTSASTAPKRRLKGRKAAKLPSIEKRNWLIYLHFTRKEFITCKSLVQEQLRETGGQCEYAIYIQGMILRTEGEIQQSLELFQACHQLNPKSPDNMKQIAKNLILLGKHKSAIECYNRAAELEAMDWEICHCLGLCHQFLKQPEKAEHYFLEALSKGKHVITFHLLSKLYLEMDKSDKAIETLKKGIEFSPENTDLLTSLGLLHLKNQSYHEAFGLLGQALTYDPENYKAILAAGSLMQKHGDFDVALTKYRVAANSVPESSSLWNNIAMCFFGKKKNVAAISCLKRANYLSPFDWRILYNLSLLHLTMQQYASAFQFASTAVTLKSNHGPLFMLLAVALSNLGQEENAEKAYQQAMQLDQSNPHTLMNYAIFLNNRGKTKQASKLLTDYQTITKDQADTDKEMADVSKRLATVLNLGERIVQEKEKSVKKKKRKEKEPAGAEATENLKDMSPPTTKEVEQINPIAQSSIIDPFSKPLGPLKPLSPLRNPGSAQSLSKLPPLRSPASPSASYDGLLSQLPTVPSHDPNKKESKKSRQAVAE